MMDRGDNGGTILEPGNGDATILEPGNGDATIQESGNGDVTIQESGNGDATIQESGNGDATIQESGNGDATIQESGNGDATIQESGNGDATIQEPGNSDATIQESGKGDATIQEPENGDATIQEPGNGDATIQEHGMSNHGEISLKQRHSQKQSTVTDEMSSTLAELSPKSQRKIHLIIKNVARKKAWLDEDELGKPTIMYEKQVPVLCHVDKSQTFMIQHPKSDNDMKNRIEVLLEFINYAKENRTPGGVVIDETKITAKTKYTEGYQFEKTREILGSGNVAGEIVVVRDTGSDTKHALKTILISEFRVDEVRMWCDLEGTGICPALYLFSIQDNKVHLHMEILKSAISLQDVLDKHLRFIPKEHIHAFSLYVFKGILSVVKTMHDKNWAHRDLHAGNIMVQKNSPYLDIKVIDFGKANKIDSEKGKDYPGRDHDIYQTIRQFSSLYTGEMFESAFDLKKNYKEKLEKMCEWNQFSYEERVELFQLVDMALNVTSRPLIVDLTNTSKGSIDDVISELDKRLKPVDVDEMCKKLAAILFSENEYHDLHTDGDLVSKGSDEDFIDSPDTLERRAASIPDDFIHRLRDGFSISPSGT